METLATIPPRKTFSVLVAKDPKELQNRWVEWEDLSRSALDPNVFYEPWIFLPAVKAFGSQADLTFILIYASEGEDASPAQQLCGFFPLILLHRYHRLPMRCFSLWRHKYCFLGTPLVRAAGAYDTLSAFCDWLATLPLDVGLMDFGYIHGEGSFARLLSEVLSERHLPFFVVGDFDRPLFRPAADVETHLKRVLSSKTHSELKRKERRLAELGTMKYSTLTSGDDIESWSRNFLSLEASGWKGQEGTALASQQTDRDFFLEIMREAFHRRQLTTHAIELDGRPIAQNCELESGRGAFCFKTAYDESYGRYSPGVLLHVERIRALHARPRIAWLDSCSGPDSYLNALTKDRVSIKSVLVAFGGIRDIFTGNALTWIKKAKRTVSGPAARTIDASL